MVDNLEIDKRIKKPSKYTCTGKTKVHHFIVDSPAGEPTVNAKCKYCQFERIHNRRSLKNGRSRKYSRK